MLVWLVPPCRASNAQQVVSSRYPPDRASPVTDKRQYAYYANVIPTHAVVGIRQVDRGDSIRAAESEKACVLKQEGCDSDFCSRQ